MSNKRVIVSLLLSLLFLSACQPAGRPATALLPQMANYSHVRAETISAMLDTMQLRALLAMDPVLAGKIWVADRLTECARKNGTLAFQGYYRLAGDQSEFGFAVIVNQARLTNPDYLLSCSDPDTANISIVPDVQPCANIWHYNEGGTSYHMLYVGTADSICEAMCNGMAGCTLN